MDFFIVPDEEIKTLTQINELQPWKMWLNNVLKKA